MKPNSEIENRGNLEKAKGKQTSNASYPDTPEVRYKYGTWVLVSRIIGSKHYHYIGMIAEYYFERVDGHLTGVVLYSVACSDSPHNPRLKPEHKAFIMQNVVEDEIIEAWDTNVVSAVQESLDTDRPFTAVHLTRRLSLRHYTQGNDLVATDPEVKS